MTIHVRTRDHGEMQFLSADDWQVRDGGFLWVGAADVGVAEFADRAWLFVYERVEQAPEKTRSWESVHDVPAGVVVISGPDEVLPSYYKWVDGVRYMDLGKDANDQIIWDKGEPGRTRESNEWLQGYAPFIELQEAK